MMWVPSVILLLIPLSCAFEPNSYDGYQVIDIVPKTEEQLTYLRDLLRDDAEIDFWEIPGLVNKRVRMMLPGNYLNAVISRELVHHDMEYTTYRDNIQQAIDAERAHIYLQKVMSGRAFDLDNYNTLSDINTWLTETRDNCSATLDCTLNEYGPTENGNTLYIFILKKVGVVNPKNVYIDAGTHPREWIAPATVFKIMDHMINNEDDPTVSDMLDKYAFHFVPVVNPDGYEHSWSSPGARLWNKNRAPHTLTNGTVCYGTQLNRNFDVRWGEFAASPFECSSSYQGASPFSEIETLVIGAYLNGIGSETQVMFTLHNGGWEFLYIWGYYIQGQSTCESSPDSIDLFEVADAAVTAMEATGLSNETWIYGNMCDVSGVLSGDTLDYSRAGSGNIKYGYNIQLRGDDALVPIEEIDMSFQEFYAGMVAAIQKIEEKTPPP